ncbi:imidazolonepropionase [Corynebacterium provencense]|uniref:imidazolonepropionase n=1 Tax=Corynebacterium provencense TaxID=1737425 RepID=UPI000AF81492|nr:imidazolonepropionase [Corynebacterium provencense]
MTTTGTTTGATSGTTTLITGISELVTNDGPDWDLGVIPGAAVLVEDGTVTWTGTAATAPDAERTVDVGGRAVIPGFVDSHSHIVFAGDRSAEFTARMAGAAYDGGGIASTVAATRSATDDALRERARRLVGEARAQGTTLLEVKSGYGLDTTQEKRLLGIAHEVTGEVTFLGGHVVPAEYRHDPDAYVHLVAGAMTQACAPSARWGDVFCEPHSPVAFDEDQSREILESARNHGLGLRVHGAQLGPGPGPRLAVELGAASVDHATFLTDADIDLLSQAAGSGGPVVTFLPVVEFSTRQPYPDARRVIDAGITVAVATDCNPGTCYSNSMSMAMAIAVREMGMTPDEALWAATAGGARALRRADVGKIAPGSRADLAVVDAPSRDHIVYRAGVPLVRALDI